MESRWDETQKGEITGLKTFGPDDSRQNMERGSGIWARKMGRNRCKVRRHSCVPVIKPDGRDKIPVVGITKNEVNE